MSCSDPAPIPIERQIEAVRREIRRRQAWALANANHPELPRVHEGLADMEAVLATLEIVQGMRLRGPTGSYVAEAIDVLAQIRDGRQNHAPSYPEKPAA